MTSDTKKAGFEDVSSVGKSCAEEVPTSTVTGSIENGLTENSRVVRKIRHASQVNSGGQGVVLSIRKETRPNKKESTPNSLLIQVQWDNGTISFVGSDAIELA
jgi:hypothetical protein